MEIYLSTYKPVIAMISMFWADFRHRCIHTLHVQCIQADKCVHVGPTQWPAKRFCSARHTHLFITSIYSDPKHLASWMNPHLYAFPSNNITPSYSRHWSDGENSRRSYREKNERERKERERARTINKDQH